MELWLGALSCMCFGPGMLTSAIYQRMINDHISLSISMASLTRQSMKEPEIAI